MIDYICKFPDEATAHLALSGWRDTDADGNSFWEPLWQCGLMEIKIINQPAVWDRADPSNPALISAEVIADGFWLAIALPHPDDDFWARPFVLSEHDRAKSKQGLPHTIRTKLTKEQITAVAGVNPVFAGSNYPFGGA